MTNKEQEELLKKKNEEIKQLKERVNELEGYERRINQFKAEGFDTSMSVEEYLDRNKKKNKLMKQILIDVQNNIAELCTVCAKKGINCVNCPEEDITVCADKVLELYGV